MFTGLISHIGEIVHVAESGAGRVMRVSAPWRDIVIGESIALDGVCLTVTDTSDGTFSVAAVTTTLERTTLGSWKPRRRVNLERALRAGDRLGGHLVQGHVDGVAGVHAVSRAGTALVIELTLWEGAESLCVPQGSITTDGVSLTVYAMPAPRIVAVSIIEHTRTHTTLGERREGDAVNVELDVIGKYVRQLAAPWTAVTPA